MKCMFALVVLLHLCYSTELTITLNKEIIDRLVTLNKLYSEVRVASPVCMPSSRMHSNASSCVGVFIRELKHLLNNVTVPEDSKNILQELKALLRDLGQHNEDNHTCQMTRCRKSLTPFSPYIAFLQALNNSKKR